MNASKNALCRQNEKKCEIITRNQTPHDKDEPINFFHGENIHTVYLKLARKAL